MGDAKMIAVQFDSEAVVEALKSEILGYARGQAEMNIGEYAEGIIRDVVEEEARVFAKEHLRELVAKMIADGWRATNNYGEPTGQTITLSSFVRETLFKRDSYGGGSVLEKIAAEQIQQALKSEMGAVLKEATEKLRAMIDSTIAEKMRGALNDAIKSKGF